MFDELRHFTLSPIPLTAVSQPKQRLLEKKEVAKMVTKNVTGLPTDSEDLKNDVNDRNTPRMKTSKEKNGKSKSLTRKDFLITELTNMAKQSMLDTYNLNVRLDVKPKFYQQFARNKRPSCKYMFPHLALNNRAGDCWRTSPSGKKMFDPASRSRNNIPKETLTFGNGLKRSSSRFDRWRQSSTGKYTESANYCAELHTDLVKRLNRDIYEVESDDESDDDNYSDISCESCYTNNPKLTEYSNRYVRPSDYRREVVRSDDSGDNITIAATSFDSLRRLDTAFSVEKDTIAHDSVVYASVTSLDRFWKKGGTVITERDLCDVSELINHNEDEDEVHGHSDRDCVVDMYSHGNRLVPGDGKNIVEPNMNDRHHLRLSTNEISTSLLDKVVPVVDARKPLRTKNDNAACRRQLKLNKSRTVRRRNDHSPNGHVMSQKSDQIEHTEDSNATRACSINDSVLNYRHKRITQQKSNNPTQSDYVRKLPTKAKVSSISSARKLSGNMVVDFESVRIASHLHRLQKHASTVGTELGYKTCPTKYSKCWGSMKGTVPVLDDRGFRSIVTGCSVKS